MITIIIIIIKFVMIKITIMITIMMIIILWLYVTSRKNKKSKFSESWGGEREREKKRRFRCCSRGHTWTHEQTMDRHDWNVNVFRFFFYKIKLIVNDCKTMITTKTIVFRIGFEKSSKIFVSFCFVLFFFLRDVGEKTLDCWTITRKKYWEII